MVDFALRQACLADEDDILRLNAASVAETSPMDSVRFRALFGMSTQTIVAEQDSGVVGFLMGFGDGSAYDSVNYRWFKDRLKRFFYIDRIVVLESARGSGIGRVFYSHIESWAQDAGLHWLAAEMNLEPVNTASLTFHSKLGFVPVGTQALEGGKVVSMQIRALQAGNAR